MSDILLVGNDMLIELRGLKDEATGEFLDSATVTVTLKTAAGANVTGGSWPMALAFLDGSNGVYRGTLADDLQLTHGATYTAIVEADGGAGRKGRWEIPCLARRRTG